MNFWGKKIGSEEGLDKIIILMIKLPTTREGKMPTVYLRKELYDEIVKRSEDVSSFVDKAVEKALVEKRPEEKKEK